MAGRTRSWLHVLGRLEEYALFMMVLQMGLSIFFQVCMRFLFHSAVTWLDELVHIEVIVLTFFGAALGIRHGSHICVDVLKERVRGEPYRSLLEALNHLVVAAYTGVVIFFGLHLITLMTRHPHFTPTLRVPKHYLYLVVCIGLALIGVRSALRFFRALFSLRHTPTAGSSS